MVRDSSGGALPGADVTITKIDTGAVRTTVTVGDGAFVLPNLPVGPYQLKVTLPGFNTYVQDGIVLQVSSNPQINVTLAVGVVSEQVTVTANTTMIETHSTGIGQVIDNQRVVELPLNGRQATELIFLSGLATSAPAGDLNTNKNYPDRDHLGGRRPGQRHDLHHGRRHAQRSVQQPEPADAVSRRAPGVQGRDQRAAGALRPPRGVGGEPGHEVGHQRASRAAPSSSTATITSTPATRLRTSATA